MNPAIARRRHAKAAAAQNSQTGSQEHQAGSHEINVGKMERQVSMIGGGLLAVCGLMRGSISGLALAALGGALVWRGYSGHCEMYHMLDHSTADGQHDHGHGTNHENSGRGTSVAADVAL